MSDLLKLAERWKLIADDYDKSAEGWRKRSTVERPFAVEVAKRVEAAEVYRSCTCELLAEVAKEGLTVTDVFEKVAARRMTPARGEAVTAEERAAEFRSRLRDCGQCPDPKKCNVQSRNERRLIEAFRAAEEEARLGALEEAATLVEDEAMDVSSLFRANSLRVIAARIRALAERES